MSITVIVGKLLIVSAILFQAYLLFEDKSEGENFDKNLKAAIAQCTCLASIKSHLIQHLRIVVTGLLASSLVIVVTKCWAFKLPTFLGLALLLWVEHHTVFTKLPTIQLLNNVQLWHSLGVIGAIIYLIGSQSANCGKNSSCSKSKPAQKQKQVAEQKKQSNRDSRGKAKTK